MKWWPKEPVKGDIVRISLGSIYHYGIFVSESEVIQFGEPPVELNRDFSKIRVISTDIDTFSSGQFVEVCEFDSKEKKKKNSVDQIVKVARSRIGEGNYDILNNNCEHFVFECVFSEKKSSQSEKFSSLKEEKEKEKNPFFHIYFYPYDESLQVSKLYTGKRNTEILFTPNKNVKREKYAAFHLLEEGMIHSLNLDPSDLSLKKESTGKWTTEKCFVSISHCKDFAICCVSDKESGIDIENIEESKRKFSDKLDLMKKRVLMDEEKLLYDDSIESFLKLWTRKESLFKSKNEKAFIGTSLNTVSSDLRSFSLSENEKSYIFSIFTKAENLKFYRYDGTSFTEVIFSEQLKEI